MVINLFCLPYAGGSASIYKEWISYSPPSLNIIPLEYKGRGSRFTEPLYENIQDCVDDIYIIIQKYISNGEKFAVFGHSMGGLIAYELCLKLKEKNKLADHLFISSRNPPHISKIIPLSNLNDKEFLKELEKIGGTPKAFFTEHELIKVYLPLIKNDFRLVEEYLYKKKIDWNNKLFCNATGFCGTEEDIFDDMKEWKNYIGNEYNVYQINGNHFYLKNSIKELINMIHTILD